MDGETVWRWRQAFGVGQWEPEGLWRLHRALSEAGAKKTRGNRMSADQVERRRRTDHELGLEPTGRWKETGWTPEQLAMLGTLADERVAARIGQTPTAVRVKRNRRVRPADRVLYGHGGKCPASPDSAAAALAWIVATLEAA